MTSIEFTASVFTRIIIHDFNAGEFQNEFKFDFSVTRIILKTMKTKLGTICDVGTGVFVRPTHMV